MKGRYLTLSAFLFIVLLLPVILFFVDLGTNDGTNKALRIINTILVSVITLIATILVLILSSLLTRGNEFRSAMIFSFTAGFFMLGMCFIGIIWHRFNKKFLSAVVLPTILLFCLGSGYALYNEHVDSIPVIKESGNMLYDYSPWSNVPKLATLSEASTLNLSDNLPKMDGATALYPVYSAFANAVYPRSVVTQHNLCWNVLKCTTTANAYESIINGEADIIFVASPSKEQEEAAKAQGVELVYTPIGKECFVFFVNSRNKLDDISVEQIRDIYSGKLTEWEELGVKHLGAIRPFQREAGSGSQTQLIRLMGDLPIIEPEMQETYDSMAGIITSVADYKNFKNAIGFSFRFYSTEMVNNKQIKLLSLNGVAPTTENIINGTYPVSGDFYAVTRSDCTTETQRLIDWILSPQGQELITKTGYVSINQ